MSILAKFTCNEVKHSVGLEAVNLTPVIGGSDENKSFSKWTPSGNLTMGITNPDVFGFFIPGKAYYITIQEASE